MFASFSAQFDLFEHLMNITSLEGSINQPKSPKCYYSKIFVMRNWLVRRQLAERWLKH